MDLLTIQKKEDKEDLFESFKKGLEDLKNKRVVKFKNSNLFK